jgi:hypothetical protein
LEAPSADRCCSALRRYSRYCAILQPSSTVTLAGCVGCRSTRAGARREMGLRFRRSVRLFPGVRLNFSGSGVSTTVGVRGAAVTLGQHGTHLNLGLPGTGLSYRTRISPPTSRSQQVEEPVSAWPESRRPTPRGAPGVAAIPGTEQEIRSADVTQLTSTGLNELKALINAARQRKSELLRERASTAEVLRRAKGRLRLAEAVIVRLVTKRWIPGLVDAANSAHDAHEDVKAQLDGCFVEVDLISARRLERATPTWSRPLIASPPVAAFGTSRAGQVLIGSRHGRPPPPR